jgi:hypothetical protein
MNAEVETWTAPPPAAGPLQSWTDEFLAVAGVAASLSRTAFVPASLRVFRDNGRTYDAEATAAQVTAAILTGRELDLLPMAALRSVDVIQGTPALRAVALRGIVLAHGHELWVEEATNTRCTVAGQRSGSDRIQRITWTIEDAKSRNLAGKPNWRSQPRNMLIARATGDVARLVAADALLGIPYTAEELEDADDTMVMPDDGAAAPSGPRKAQRRTTPRTALVSRGEPPTEDEPAIDEPAVTEAPRRPADDEPTLDEPTLDDAAPDAELPGPEPISQPQMRKMQAQFRDLGVTDRAERLEFVRRTIDRQVATSSDLTLTEANVVISALDRELATLAETNDPNDEGTLTHE